MELDFNSEESRKNYLKDKLDDLLEGISDTYGTSLMEELISRLELTIKDFNEEMSALCDELVKKEKERQQILELIKSGDTSVKFSKRSGNSIFLSDIVEEIGSDACRYSFLNRSSESQMEIDLEIFKNKSSTNWEKHNFLLNKLSKIFRI